MAQTNYQIPSLETLDLEFEKKSIGIAFWKEPVLS